VNYRRRVAVVGDPLERDITEPPRRLTGNVDEPMPVVVIVDVNLAVRLDDVALRNNGIMESAPVDSPDIGNRAAERPVAIDAALAVGTVLRY
jgi:hypothetical protein